MAAVSLLSKTPPKEKTVPSLPPIINNKGRKVSADSAKSDGKNPFTMPPDYELFTLRERERNLQREERAIERKLPVHEKPTYASRMNKKLAAVRQAAMTPESSSTDIKGFDQASRIHENTQFVLATTRERRVEKEDLNNYLNKKREMFLMQYSLGVKRDEIQKLEDIAKTEERKIEAAEQYLEQSAAMFDEFLKENDKNSVEAIKMAEAATKAKLEKVAEIKRLNSQVMAIKSEISRNDDHLNELKTYRQFLNELAPQEWHEVRKRRLEEMKRASDATENETLDEEVYFDNPAQLLEIFTELEEQNLSLIQNSQETEETLDEIKHSRRSTQDRMNYEVQVLRFQISELEKMIEKEEAKSLELETKAKLFSFGEYKAEDQEAMLSTLDKKVADVYNKCIGGNEAAVSTLQMLTAIEGRMEELFEELETLPVEKVESAEKAKEKERRLRMREQKLQEQRLHQEERLKRALERAQADPKRTTGRRLVYRSEPPVLKHQQKHIDDQREKEEEEMQYFFT
ncbi:PREDICTED: cilia- and flagella-associated protein 100-like [Amphimedon queenslandica]|uniref:DUF4200 domain-containing protein n=1 Tax=Amphimedon queenslandica TaxID=400682 RepID=A0AAN0JFL9_AMPQE|nr:PREDICTED: cilia- and flagella-associated protein 100-like [Amphimedon queenslandica]|eukprot:XP_019855759.1 PREDICTED: cilia- and flagella-associated protein 100-like [Amphimedon queenslandica]